MSAGEMSKKEKCLKAPVESFTIGDYVMDVRKSTGCYV